MQPPSADNPTGASYVFVLDTITLDECRRRQGKQFNWLDAEGLKKIEAAARASAGMPLLTPEGGLEQMKDEAEGREHAPPEANYEEDVGHLPVRLLMAFDRWDIDGDGLSEDGLFIIARDAEVLCEARLLTERWPAKKPYRPLAEACPIPVPGRWYGISLLELGESMYDLIKGTFDQSFDAWTIANLPIGFYGASSKLNTDIVKIRPGSFYPVPGNPRETLYIPTFPQRDQSTALGIIGLGMQLFQQALAQGPLQQGQVPTGRSSALRTYGTTFALLQQGDVRADQLLLRIFNGLRQVARNFHRMNRHLLPPGKEFRIVGWDGAAADAYVRIESVDQIDAEFDFDFRPDFLNSNPAVLTQSLQTVLTILATPLAFQLGITNAQFLYRIIKDLIRSLRLDPKLYSQPPGPDALPPILAEEAIAKLVEGQEVMGMPMEGAEQHLQKLFEWVQSDAFGHLPPAHVATARAWLEQVAARAQQAKVMAAAQ
ncbi:MAG: hypothetical protein Q8S13_01510, partial [Dehalococcoidia bacterium]|nr:hypothetical protein [Dehalococcoidia bacterium]